MTRFRAVVCGGGVAGIEAVLSLRARTGDALDITLITPAAELVYRPLSVLEPFRAGEVRRYPLSRIVADTGVTWVQDALSHVDRVAGSVHTSGGSEHGYDALLLALGGHRRPPPPGVFEFSESAVGGYRRLLDAISDGTLGSLLFAVPDGPAWPLPLYELALLTAQHAHSAGRNPEIGVAEPAERPLGAFGGEAGATLAATLDRAGVDLHARHSLSPSGQVQSAAGSVLDAQQVVTVPRISGPNVRGIAGDGVDRFLEVDPYCRVVSADGRVFAAGDATDLPVKLGGIGAQQADTAAAGIAHLAGLAERPEPLHPLAEAVLLTGGPPLYLSAHVIAGEGWTAELHPEPWPERDKIVATELGPYLASLDVEPARGSAPEA